MKRANKRGRKSARGTTASAKKPRAFTGEERAAMRERLQELKAEARHGRGVDEAEGESAALVKQAAS